MGALKVDGAAAPGIEVAKYLFFRWKEEAAAGAKDVQVGVYVLAVPRRRCFIPPYGVVLMFFVHSIWLRLQRLSFGRDGKNYWDSFKDCRMSLNRRKRCGPVL